MQPQRMVTERNEKIHGLLNHDKVFPNQFHHAKL